MWICDCGPKFFADLKLLQVRKHILSPYKYRIYCSHSILYKIKNLLKRQLLELFETVLSITNFVEICGIIMKICGFVICELAHLRYLRIFDSRRSGFAICGLLKKYACSFLEFRWARF
jgi:hypothetical protein